MKLLTYEMSSKLKTGILIKKEIVDVEALMNRNLSMNEIIEGGEALLLSMERKLSDYEGDRISLSNVKVCAPIPYPKRHIFCLGKNYLDHANETKGLPGSDSEIPRFPIYFTKIADPAIGPFDMIKSYPELTDKVDYEVELGVIIGKSGINISVEDAKDYIYGYTIINDISARNIQRKHGQWFRGKSLDTYTPMGPYVVTADEIPWPVELDIKCYVNDELRQDSNTSQLIFDIPSIISDLSKGLHLKAGDIIATGTPSGVGLGFKPFKFLNHGDQITCEIEKIGTLTNHYE